MDSKTEPASEAKEHECEYYLDGESIVYGCECGDIEIGGKIYYPEDKVNQLKEEITRLKAEMERERELRKELALELNRLIVTTGHAMHENTISHIKSLIEKAKN